MERELDEQQKTQKITDEKASLLRHLSSGETLVKRYQIQDVIGVGGMGSVYRARDLHFPNVNKIVAVKEMLIQAPDLAIRNTIIKNFEREANILVALSHSAIPKIFDYFTQRERSYLVLEYIHGKDLEAILNSINSFFPEDQLIMWSIELCDVLSYLHNHKPAPIIFRDIKPSNIMINQQGHVVLIDFGIAKNFKVGQKGTMIGTEGYSPPEQYRGEATTLADIYALGATLHHLLTRRDPRIEPPFTFAERTIRSINPAVTPDFEAIVEKALCYEPSERFQSAEEMKDALLSVAGKTGALSRVALRKGSKSKEQKIKPLWKFECEDEVRGSAGIIKDMVGIGAYDNNMYALQPDSGEMIWKCPCEGGIVSRPLTIDDTVYFGSEDGLLYAVSSRTGRTMWTYKTGGAIRSSPVAAEDYLFIGSDDGFLHAINSVSKRDIWKFDASGTIRSGPIIYNNSIIFGCETGEIYVVDFRGDLRWRFRAKRSVQSSPVVSEDILVMSSLDTQIYGLDVKSGWPVWKFRMNRGTVSTAYISDGMVFAGSADGNLYCLGLSNGKEIWHYDMGEQISGSPLVYKDSVFVGGGLGSFICLEYKTGRLRWKYKMEGPITGTPLNIADKIIIGSFDHNVYAFSAI